MTQNIKWHRFPEEVPYSGDIFLVTIKTFEGPLQVTILRYISHAGMTAFEYFTEAQVIAWAEVEPFNEVEDPSDAFNDYFDDVVEVRE